jgi:hypothetical protein
VGHVEHSGASGARNIDALLFMVINTSDTSTPTHNQISGLITRARACQLNNQVSSFLASYSTYLDNGNVCSVLLLWNNGHEGNGVAYAPERG